MKLSEHFTLEEFVYSETAIRKGIDNAPNESVEANLLALLQVQAHLCIEQAGWLLHSH